MIADYAGAALVTIAMVVLLGVLRVPDDANKALGISQRALVDLSNRHLDDETKQDIAQRASVRLLARFLSITLRLGVAFGAPLVVVWALGQVGAMNFAGVLQAGLSWPFIVAAASAVVVMFLLKKAKSH